MTLFPKVQGRQLPHHEHSRADPERPGLPLRGRSCHRRALQRHQGDDGAFQRERGVPRLHPRVPRPGRPGSLPGGQGPGQVRGGGLREQPHHRAPRREDSRQEVILAEDGAKNPNSVWSDAFFLNSEPYLFEWWYKKRYPVLVLQ